MARLQFTFLVVPGETSILLAALHQVHPMAQVEAVEGGDNPSTYDSSGARGFGGSAGTRRISSIEVVYGDVLTVSIGASGPGSIAGYRGGDGAVGYARLTWNEKAASFTASGSVVID